MADIPLAVRQEGAAFAAAGAEKNLTRGNAKQERYAQEHAKFIDKDGKKKGPERIESWASEAKAHAQIDGFLGEKARPVKADAETAERSVRELSELGFKDMNPTQQHQIRELALSALDQIPELKPYREFLDSLAAGGIGTNLRDAV
ncbi:MAG: hypothetical protein ACHQT7_02170, partial [Candidatus Levyibacteriota bacterium]